jgi:hypothetical protein
MFMTNMVWKASRLAPVVVAAWTTSSACSWVAEAVVELLSREKLVLSHKQNKLTSAWQMFIMVRLLKSRLTDKESAVSAMVSEELTPQPFKPVLSARVKV